MLLSTSLLGMALATTMLAPLLAERVGLERPAPLAGDPEAIEARAREIVKSASTTSKMSGAYLRIASSRSRASKRASLVPVMSVTERTDLVLKGLK